MTRPPSWLLILAAFLGPIVLTLAWDGLFDRVARSSIHGYALANLNNALFMLLALGLVAFVVIGRRMAAESPVRTAFVRIATIVSLLVFCLAFLGHLAG
jgi:hypothetical protein